MNAYATAVGSRIEIMKMLYRKASLAVLSFARYLTGAEACEH